MHYLTAGESHGPCVIAIIDGVPTHLRISPKDINYELERRQIGYGRSERMQIEKDKVEILSGVRNDKTTGSPIALLIKNKDFSKSLPEVNIPRPGHADLAGVLKFNQKDARDILERASARETASRVACGAVAKVMLREFDIKVCSHVRQIGKIKVTKEMNYSKVNKSPLMCADPGAEKLMKKEIDDARKRGDTVGGIFEVICKGVPPGIGSYTQWDKRLDGRLAYVLMSIPGVKGVEIGLGFSSAGSTGSRVHDEIFYKNDRFYRKTNNAGGIEGGISNGEDIILRAVMKPIPTLGMPLKSIGLSDKLPKAAHKERADICAVPSCSVVGEAVVAFELARAMQEKFGGDSMEEMKRNHFAYIKAVKEY
ncbi:MAG: chorismate synthase [Candidatus Stahlbacteria bacterium]|nr:chorismate synthase [Candidatus Stahlbacteria bacterium]